METRDENRRGMRTFTGIPASRGAVRGRAILLRAPDNGNFSRRKAAGPAEETARLDAALALTAAQIRAVSAEVGKWISGAESSIFESHRMMAEDPTFTGECRELIAAGGVSAEAAVMRVADKYARIFAGMNDPLLRERSGDISGIARRIVRNLNGAGAAQAVGMTCPGIIVTDELTPYDVLSLPKKMILGIAADKGSLTSHAALLARALGIPSVVGFRKLSEYARPGELVLLDAVRGRATVNPGDAESAAFAEIEKEEGRIAADIRACRGGPGRTADNIPVPLLANVDTNTPPDSLPASGAEGIGLYRSEYLWLSLNREPTEEEQTRAYAAAVRAMPPGAPVTIRLMDLGGDKLPWAAASAREKKEANPALGQRSLRYLLHHPATLRAQLRAILRASPLGDVRILYPMVATREELRAVNLELARCKTALAQEGVPFNDAIPRGVMIEIPSAALAAEGLAREADFFSIGTNDLVQYTMAADRVNERVSKLYQPTGPAVLKLIAMTVAAARARGIPVSVCGEAASDPVTALLFIGMGVNALSMTPNMIPPVKRALRRARLPDLQCLAADVLSRMSASPASRIYAACRKRIEKMGEGKGKL